MYSLEEQETFPVPIAKVTPNERSYNRNKDFSITICIAVVASIIFPPLGLVALILAVIAATSRENTIKSERFRKYSHYLSLSAYFVAVLSFVAILMVAFANRGSDIYVRPPGVEPGHIFWQSQA